jgi:AcrR family transcriptional regulator
MNSVKIKSTRTPKKARRAAYHHGDLRQKLLEVTEAILLEKGVDGFTLREAARRAGVSPAAPAHHFEDARGLLTAVALLGFQEFGAALARADAAAGPDPVRRLHEQGLAYVRFALEQPARFQLMFRHEKLDLANQELATVAKQSYEVLERAVRAATHTAPDVELSKNAYGYLLANWSIVHGFAHLALANQFRDPHGAALASETLLPLMLQHLPRLTDEKKPR